MKEYNRGMRQALILLAFARPWNHNNSVPLSSASAFVVLRKQPHPSRHHSYYRSFVAPTTPVLLLAKPKKAGSTVDSYQTVSVNCSKCQQRLFRYKKKNGTKSNLIKCYIERISEDSAGVLAMAVANEIPSGSEPTPTTNTNINRYPRTNTNEKKRRRNTIANMEKPATIAAPSAEPNVSMAVPTTLDPEYSWECPSCHTKFARSSRIHGRPALKLVGGKTRMTKK